MLEKNIEFTLIDESLQYTAEFPSPAEKNLPQWYKKMPSFINNEKKYGPSGNPELTIKKCMPVFDAISFGYIIKTWTEVNFNENQVSWSVKDSSLIAIDGHSIEQIPGYPITSSYKREAYKWTNPWHIKTPKGYSCLFITPIGHHLPFKLIEGVVDTDTFPLTVNFPFFLNSNFQGTIPHNTPMVQVIPFKRDSFKSKESLFDKIKYEKLKNYHDKYFMNKYKLNWRSRKEFK